jgi:hypothetical protein
MAFRNDQPPSHGAALRRALLHKLPALDHDGTSLGAGPGLDLYRDLKDTIEVDVDGFLVPLAATQPGERR